MALVEAARMDQERWIMLPFSEQHVSVVCIVLGWNYQDGTQGSSRSGQPTCCSIPHAFDIVFISSVTLILDEVTNTMLQDGLLVAHIDVTSMATLAQSYSLYNTSL